MIEDKAGAKDAHPDHALLAAWDADKDGKISKAEFDNPDGSGRARPSVGSVPLLE